jgi:AraC-like DNA-binding protein
MSFTAGLFAGPVVVSCDAGAELLQVDLTPLGAVRLFGGAAADLAAQVVDLRAVDQFDGEFEAIHDRLHDAPDWQARFDLIERLLAPRFGQASSIRIQHAWRLLAQGHSVSQTAAAIGRSSRHLRTKFRWETGIRPVTAAGYSDQAHLIREFHDFAGESPMAWAQRSRPSMPRLHI